MIARLAGRSTTTASHVNNLATHKNVFLSASKKLGPGAAVSSKKPEEEVHCHSCKKDCSKQRFYKKQVSVEAFLPFSPKIYHCWLCFYSGIWIIGVCFNPSFLFFRALLIYPSCASSNLDPVSVRIVSRLASFQQALQPAILSKLQMVIQPLLQRCGQVRRLCFFLRL